MSSKQKVEIVISPIFEDGSIGENQLSITAGSAGEALTEAGFCLDQLLTDGGEESGEKITAFDATILIAS